MTMIWGKNHWDDNDISAKIVVILTFLPICYNDILEKIYLNDCEDHFGHLINVSKSDSWVRNKFKK